MSKINTIIASEILDSRGNPTIHVVVETDDGFRGVASVPSGASTGEHEALELRDGDKERYNGLGVLKAVNNVNEIIAPKIIGEDVTKQYTIDQKMIDLDGTENKTRLGANAILGVSLAVAKAASVSLGYPLYRYISDIARLNGDWQEDLGVNQTVFQLPGIMSVMIEAGKHSSSAIEIQELMVTPSGNNFKKSLEQISEIYHRLEKSLISKGKGGNVGLEGAFAPDLNSSEEAIDLILEAIAAEGIKAGEEIGLSIDVAASEFYNKEHSKYLLKSQGVSLSREQMIGLLSDWIEKYPIVSIEDGLFEDDWEGWKAFTQKFGEKILIVGDDLFVTNSNRLSKGIDAGIANSLIIKPNQIGTLKETLDTIRLAKKNGYKTIISHRSGETEETFIADLAVAVGSEFIKTGAPARGERVAKYNRLLEIEEELSLKNLE